MTFTVLVKIELSGQDGYEPTAKDADTVVETALGALYNHGYEDDYVVFDGYPSVVVLPYPYSDIVGASAWKA